MLPRSSYFFFPLSSSLTGPNNRPLFLFGSFPPPPQFSILVYFDSLRGFTYAPILFLHPCNLQLSVVPFPTSTSRPPPFSASRFLSFLCCTPFLKRHGLYNYALPAFMVPFHDLPASAFFTADLPIVTLLPLLPLLFYNTVRFYLFL